MDNGPRFPQPSENPGGVYRSSHSCDDDLKYDPDPRKEAELFANLGTFN
jgi:hypothetical protein